MKSTNYTSITKMDATSVRKALKSRNISTSTPGKKGDARMKELRQRLEEADQQLNTARSTTSINSSYSNYSESSTSSRRPPRSKMDATSVRKALKSRNISTSTPGKKGNERKELLEERLAMNSNSNSFQQEEEETEQAPLHSSRNNTNGSCSARSESTPSQSTTARRRTPQATTITTNNNKTGDRPSSAPIHNQDNIETQQPPPNTARAPWAVRTRLGRGRGRSRGACRGGISTRGSGRGRRTNKRSSSASSVRRPLIEKKGNTTSSTANSIFHSNSSTASTPTLLLHTETPRLHIPTPRGTRGQPPVSARLTARLTAVESLHTEASEELEDAEKEYQEELQEGQRLREYAAELRNTRESVVAAKSDPLRNTELNVLVNKLDEARNELKALYAHKSSNSGGSGSTQYFDSKLIHGTSQRFTISKAFKELEAMERTLDDEIDHICTTIVLKEEKSNKYGLKIEESYITESEKSMIRAGRLKRMLPALRDRELVAKARLDAELERRSARPPHPGSDAVKDPLKLAENAEFLWQVRDDEDTADRVFNQALSRAPDNSKILHLYATFLHKSSKRQHQTSARMWQRAVLLAPRDADILTGYGTLLHRVMCKPMDAKPLIMRALAVNPHHPFALLANALLLQANRDYEESEANFREARKYLPTELSIVTHYANFLKKCRTQYKEAEALFEIGMKLNPCDADHLGAFAQFNFKIRGNTDRADHLFAKAIECDANHWHNLSRYANMLKKTGRYDEAEKCYQNACTSSTNPTTCGNYANFLQLIRNDWEAAQKYYLKALSLDPNHNVVKKNYATFLRDHPEARVKRNESVVDQTPLAKALSRSNRNYRSPQKSTNKKMQNTGTPKSTGKSKKKFKMKTPTMRPRQLAPELEGVVEGV